MGKLGTDLPSNRQQITSNQDSYSEHFDSQKTLKKNKQTSKKLKQVFFLIVENLKKCAEVDGISTFY